MQGSRQDKGASAIVPNEAVRDENVKAETTAVSFFNFMEGSATQGSYDRCSDVLRQSLACNASGTVAKKKTPQRCSRIAAKNKLMISRALSTHGIEYVSRCVSFLSEDHAILFVSYPLPTKVSEHKTG